MINASIEKLILLRKTNDELAYIKQLKACVGSIGRIPNGALKGHVNRDHLAEAVVKLITELDNRIGHLTPTGHSNGAKDG